MTRFVHGDQALEEAQEISQALFSGDIADLSADQVASGLQDVPTSTAPRGEHDIVEFLVDITGIVQSRRQAREFLDNGAITIRGQRIQDRNYTISQADSFDNRFIVVRRGKKKYFIVNLTD